MKLGLRPLRVIAVAAAHVPTYGTLSSWNTGSIASPTGECRPPNTATAFSRSMTSRAPVTPFEGLPSSSRTTSSSVRPESSPPRALISSMATLRPRLMASPESAEPPDIAATSATVIGGFAWVKPTVACVPSRQSVRSTSPSHVTRRIGPPGGQSAGILPRRRLTRTDAPWSKLS